MKRVKIVNQKLLVNSIRNRISNGVKLFVIAFTICCSLFTIQSFSQNAGVGINNSGKAADNSAILDVSSTTQGLLVPRMTTIQRNLISNPANSLLIYNTTTQCFEAWNQTAQTWVDFGCVGCQIPAQPTAGTNTPSQTQIVWNWSDVSSPVSYEWGTTTSYGSATNNGTSTSYTQTGLTCNTPYTLYVWAYNACGNSGMTTLTQTSSSCSFTCGNSFTVTHTAGSIAPITETVTYSTVLTTLTGASECWITQNLGATQQASSVTDGSYSAAGWYWEWDTQQGYDQTGPNGGGTLTPSTFGGITSSGTTWVTANDPCNLLLGAGWRIPTYTEWNNVATNVGWGSCTSSYNSVLILSASSGWLAAEGTPGMLYGRGSESIYWTSTQSPYVTTDGWSFSCDSFAGNEKAGGFTLRCLNP